MFIFQKILSKQKVEVYGKDVGLFQNGKYSAVAQSLLSQSVASDVNPAQVAILRDKVQLSSTTYLDGKEHGGINEMIVPGNVFWLFCSFSSVFLAIKCSLVPPRKKKIARWKCCLRPLKLTL